MWLCYLLACIPVAIGSVFWVCSKRIVWWEWLTGSAAAFALAALFNILSVNAMLADKETWSGQVVSVTFHPAWVARWTTTETYTTGSGKNRSTHTRTVHHVQHYPESWSSEDTLGSCDIGQSTYSDFKTKLGGSYNKQWACKLNFASGDHNIYVTGNTTSVCIPVQEWRSFENRVKAAPSLFAFAKVPEKTPVFEYPTNGNRFASNRLMGNASKAVTTLEWDQLNARLGPTKRVNVIALGLAHFDASMGQWQEAKWIGGKKNDLVICFDDPEKPTWVYVFGWTEQDLVKRNLETIILENGFTSSVLPKIEQEICTSYILKDWKKFNYLTVEPAPWMWHVLIVVMVVVQGAFWTWSFLNREDKSNGQA